MRWCRWKDIQVTSYKRVSTTIDFGADGNGDDRERGLD